MNSSRPYLIRAIYQWIVDNGATPHLLVDAAHADVLVPQEYVENNKIILNIGPMAAHGLKLGNDQVDFSARFSGKSLPVVVPVQAVLAIYARENGQGMVFNDERSRERKVAPDTMTAPRPQKSEKPKLRVVK